MKKTFSAILLLLVIFSVSCRDTDSDIDPESRLWSPLFIENLQKRDYSSTIVIENTISEKSEYTSYRVRYDSDGLKQYALMNVPATGSADDVFPVIVVNHGYIPPAVYRTEKHYRLITTYFAKQGFLVLKPDYRGHDRSEAGPLQQPFSRVSYAVDVLNLVAGIPGIKEADSNNIFMFGHSMGGDVTLRSLQVNRAIRAASIWAGVTARFPESTAYFVRKRDPDAAAKLEQYVYDIYTKEEMTHLSPIDNLHYMQTPLIIHHGTLDSSVPFEWSSDFTKALDAAGREYTFHSYVDDHNFAQKYYYTVLGRDAAFFKKHVVQDATVDPGL
jgi:dipeptidyl aminopeptidase/acylaminoacyl peptidase